MTKKKCSAVFLAVRGIRRGVPVRCLTFLALAAFSTGCITNQVKDFTPKSAMVCDQVRITGTFHKDWTIWTGSGSTAFPPMLPSGIFPPPTVRWKFLPSCPKARATAPSGSKFPPRKALTFGAKGTDHTFRRGLFRDRLAAGAGHQFVFSQPGDHQTRPDEHAFSGRFRRR